MSISRRVGTLAERAYWFRHIRTSIRLSACIGSAPTGQISVKFDIGDFHKNMSRKPKFD